jgi:hypothetical protein
MITAGLRLDRRAVIWARRAVRSDPISPLSLLSLKFTVSIVFVPTVLPLSVY